MEICNEWSLDDVWDAHEIMDAFAAARPVD